MTLISIPPNGTISYRKDIKYGVSSRLTVQAESLTFAEVMVFKTCANCGRKLPFSQPKSLEERF